LKRLLIIASAILTLSACQKQTDLIAEATESMGNTEPIVAIKTNLKNPYSVDNMRKAYSNLALSEDLDLLKNVNKEIKATHLYVQFVPKTPDELSALDTSIILYNYPMDNEVLDEAQVSKEDRCGDRKRRNCTKIRVSSSFSNYT